MSPGLLAVIAVVAISTLDGLLAGAPTRARFVELKQPAASPPFVVWVAAQWLYYGLCCGGVYVLAKSAARGGDVRLATTLLAAMIVCNSSWNFLFFRKRNLAGAAQAAIAYAAIAIGVAVSFFLIEAGIALLFAAFAAFVVYGAWWTLTVYHQNSGRTFNEQ